MKVLSFLILSTMGSSLLTCLTETTFSLEAHPTRKQIAKIKIMRIMFLSIMGSRIFSYFNSFVVDASKIRKESEGKTVWWEEFAEEAGGHFTPPHSHLPPVRRFPIARQGSPFTFVPQSIYCFTI